MTEPEEELRYGRRLPKSRNSDWNEVVPDTDKNIFFKVYGTLNRDLANKRL